MRTFGEIEMPVLYDGTFPYHFARKRKGEIVGRIEVEKGQVIALNIGHEVVRVQVTEVEKTPEGDTRFTFEVIE